MVFKLTVFALILVAIAWLGTRGYRDAVRRFERQARAADEMSGREAERD